MEATQEIIDVYKIDSRLAEEASGVIAHSVDIDEIYRNRAWLYSLLQPSLLYLRDHNIRYEIRAASNGGVSVVARSTGRVFTHVSLCIILEIRMLSVTIEEWPSDCEYKVRRLVREPLKGDGPEDRLISRAVKEAVDHYLLLVGRK